MTDAGMTDEGMTDAAMASRRYDERPQRSAYAMCGARPKCDLVLERLPDGRTEPDDARIYFSCYVEKYIGRDRERVKGGIVVFF